MTNCFFNQMKNLNTLTHRIIAKQSRVTTVAGSQTISFRGIKRKRGAKTATQAHIKILSRLVDELVTDNEKKQKQKAYNRYVKDFIQKSKTGKRNMRK